MGMHGFHGVFQSGHLVNGGEIHTHYLSYFGAVGITPLQDYPFHEIALAENAAKLVSV
jgi:hypothetical protein